MRLLVIDGNSIVNRAFYGIKLLSTKDGQYTNALVGFLNILQKLQDMAQPCLLYTSGVSIWITAVYPFSWWMTRKLSGTV